MFVVSEHVAIHPHNSVCPQPVQINAFAERLFYSEISCFADLTQNQEFYRNADVRPPFTYASLIRQVRPPVSLHWWQFKWFPMFRLLLRSVLKNQDRQNKYSRPDVTNWWTSFSVNNENARITLNRLLRNMSISLGWESTRGLDEFFTKRQLFARRVCHSLSLRSTRYGISYAVKITALTFVMPLGQRTLLSVKDDLAPGIRRLRASLGVSRRLFRTLVCGVTVRAPLAGAVYSGLSSFILVVHTALVMHSCGAWKFAVLV